MPTMSELRAADGATCALILLIEGIRYTWCTDHPGDGLLGSGASSWWGIYEQDHQDWEEVGQRIMLPGLRMPRGLQRGRLRPETGLLESTSASFEIVDIDDVLGGLFAPDGKVAYQLAERVVPGTSPLGGSLAINGFGGLVDPRGQNIGIERIGPDGQRRWLNPWPWQGIGFHHEVHANAQSTDVGPPPTMVSASPIVWAGRTVTLWRVYLDRSLGDGSSASHWPAWNFQQVNLEWWGVLRDAGDISGDRTYKVQCYGAESQLRRQLGTNESTDWAPIIGTDLNLTEQERGCAVAFKFWEPSATAPTIFNSVAFTTDLSASGDKVSYQAEINTIIQNAADGTTVGDFGSTNFNDAHEQEVYFGTDMMTVRRNDQDEPGNQNGATVVHICLHEKVWALFGYDVVAQNKAQPTTVYEIRFGEVNTGNKFTNEGVDDVDTALVPGPGYVTASLTTFKLGSPYPPPVNIGTDDSDNDGAIREFKPIHGTPMSLSSQPAGDIFRVQASFPYIASDATVPIGTTQIDGNDVDSARYFLFRGVRVLPGATGATDDDEREEIAQVARVNWRSGGTYGDVLDDGGGYPAFALEQWLIPRRFGIDQGAFDGTWVGDSSSDEQRIECRPLRAYAYKGTTDVERSWAVLGQVLLSTGTGDGTPGGGENSPSGSVDSAWFSDVVAADLALGIPRQIVADPDDVYAVFDQLPGGAHGGINRCRYAFAEPFNSWDDIIAPIIQTRGLALTLRGGRFSVQDIMTFDPGDVDANLTEEDFHGDLRDLSSAVPTQALRAVGPLDRAEITVRWNPVDNELAHEQVQPARDPAARHRRGDLVDEVTDPGLIPDTWRAGDDPVSGAPWTPAFAELWGKKIANWRARRHFLVQATISRQAGQDLWPGSTVRVTHRRILDTTGTVGVTARFGLVIAVQPDYSRGDLYHVEILLYAGQDAVRVWAPIAKIVNPYAGGTTVTLEEDWLGHGQGADARGFAEPEWSTVGGQAMVRILEYDRINETLHSDYRRVVSVTDNTVVIESSFPTLHLYTDKWLMLAPYDEQDADAWPRQVFLPIVTDDLQHGSVPTAGTPFLDP